MSKMNEKKEPVEILSKPIPSQERPVINLRYDRDQDRKPVRGKFKFNELDGGHIEFCYRKYKEDPIERYTLYDGQVYTLPLGVAKHLNTNGWYPIHAHYKGEDEKYSVKVSEKKYRFAFNSLEFLDISEMGDQASSLVTAEHVSHLRSYSM